MNPVLAGLLCLLLAMTACRSQEVFIETETGELREAEIEIGTLAEQLPDYTNELQTLSGRGRLLISQPGGSDRLSLDYYSDRESSLITFRNRVGIEGGQLLVKQDSILVYNRVDRVAERYSLEDGELTELGELATVNLMELFHFPVERDSIDQLFEGEEHYVIVTPGETRITIDKERLQTVEAHFRPGSNARYSRIVFEEYAEVDGFFLPRKITIFSTGGETRLTLLVRDLQANPTLPALDIDLPDDIPVRTL